MGWKPGRRGVVAAAVGILAAAWAAGSLFSAGGASALTSTSRWEPAHHVAIGFAAGVQSEVTALSCPAPGACLAAGSYFNSASEGGFVIQQENGTWGAAAPIPGLPADPYVLVVTSVSCASPGNCAVVGRVDAPYPTSGSANVQRGFVVSETDGTWGTADILPPPAAAAKLYPAGMTSVSCSAPGDCVAGGYDTTDYQTTEAEVVEETNGTWGAPALVPGAPALDRVNSVSCTAPGDCVAGLGTTPDSGVQQGVVAAFATQSGGTWSVLTVPGVSALVGQPGSSGIDSVSCPKTGECTAAGDAVSGGRDLAFVVGEQGGTWGQASQLPNGPSGDYGTLSLSCAAPGDCALGDGDNIANEVNGTWTSSVVHPSLPSCPANVIGGCAVVTAVSCPSPGNCTAGGADEFAYDALVVDEVNGTWGDAVQVPGTGTGTSLSALSCAADGSCVAVGTDSAIGAVGYYAEEVPVRLPPGKVTYPRGAAVRVLAPAVLTYAPGWRLGR